MDEKLERLSAVNSLLATAAQLMREIESYVLNYPEAIEDLGIHARGAIETLQEVFEREAKTVREKS